jgi:hypothetical protein
VKNKGYSHNLITYSIWVVFLVSLLFLFPGNYVLSATEDPNPTIEIISPVSNSKYDYSMIEFTGTVSDDLTPSDQLIIRVLEVQPLAEPLDITNEGQLIITNKGDYSEWSYKNEFNITDQTLSFMVMDENGNSTSVTHSFTIKGIHDTWNENTNSCAYCHSTHNGSDTGLKGGQFGIKPDNYCMACHDGTSAPVMPNYNENNKHYKTEDGSIKQDACTSCHNPHLGYSEGNPNKLKGYFEYNHDSNNLNEPVNSMDTLCENCHEPEDSKRDIVLSNTHYRVLSYSKTLANTQNFDLCLRCHDEQNGIKQYYDDTNSGHNISAQDGSLLSGQMPCSDCHETHGENNPFQLKQNLGHINRVAIEKFNTTEWSTSIEREFCLKCHNNAIVMYGKTATYSEKNGLDETINGHESSSEQPCSLCHGYGDDFLERTKSAAHAPIRGSVLNPPEAEPKTEPEPVTEPMSLIENDLIIELEDTGTLQDPLHERTETPPN